jgi:siroheme synthase-like protein
MYFPVSLKVGGERALVVGGGAVALRKARALLRAGARVRAVSPEFDPAFRRLRVDRLRRRFPPRDVAGAFLVVSAADDPSVNRAVCRACRARRILVNVVDRPDLCTFILPSVVRRGAVTVAVSTGARSPSLAKALRKRIARLCPPSLGRLAERLGRARRRVLRTLPASPARTRLLRSLLETGAR